MRVVLDTNTLVSAIISPTGPPRILLNGARNRLFELFSSPVLLAELYNVISRNKFAKRFEQAELTPFNIISEIRRIAYIVKPIHVPRVIINDPDDDHVLACALACDAYLIVSGDKHILNLGDHYLNIRISNAIKSIEILALKRISRE